MEVTTFDFTTKSIEYAIYPIADFAAGRISRERHLPSIDRRIKSPIDLSAPKRHSNNDNNNRLCALLAAVEILTSSVSSRFGAFKFGR